MFEYNVFGSPNQKNMVLKVIYGLFIWHLIYLLFYYFLLLKIGLKKMNYQRTYIEDGMKSITQSYIIMWSIFFISLIGIIMYYIIKYDFSLNFFIICVLCFISFIMVVINVTQTT